MIVRFQHECSQHSINHRTPESHYPIGSASPHAEAFLVASSWSPTFSPDDDGVGSFYFAIHEIVCNSNHFGWSILYSHTILFSTYNKRWHETCIFVIYSRKLIRGVNLINEVNFRSVFAILRDFCMETTNGNEYCKNVNTQC